MFNSGDMNEKKTKDCLKLKLSKIHYKRSQMYPTDKLFYCQCGLLISERNKPFADPDQCI